MSSKELGSAHGGGEINSAYKAKAMASKDAKSQKKKKITKDSGGHITRGKGIGAHIGGMANVTATIRDITRQRSSQRR